MYRQPTHRHRHRHGTGRHRHRHRHRRRHRNRAGANGMRASRTAPALPITEDVVVLGERRASSARSHLCGESLDVLSMTRPMGESAWASNREPLTIDVATGRFCRALHCYYTHPEHGVEGSQASHQVSFQQPDRKPPAGGLLYSFMA